MCAITAPNPFSGVADDAGARRVEIDIPAYFQQVRILIDQNAFEAPLKQVPHLAMPPVVELGVNAVQLAHQLGQSSPPRSEHKVVVIVHETVGEDTGVEAFNGLRDDTQQRLAVGVIFNDGLATIVA